jgi:hypothetical protein
VLEDTKMLGIKGGSIERVLKESCYGKAQRVGDAEEVVRWWRYNSAQ